MVLCGGFVIQSQSELRDLESGMLIMTCHDVELQAILEEITGEVFNGGAYGAPISRIDIFVCGLWERQRSADLDLTTKKIYCQPKNEKKPMYASRVMEVEQATFTPIYHHRRHGRKM